MRINWSILFISACLAFGSPEKKKITIWLCGDSTMSVKEARAYPETGWGMPFVNFFDSSVIVRNLAKNGRSTRTFITEKLWQTVADNAREGDYVFIQFGHNDEAKEKTERYTSPEEYKSNLWKFIEESRNKKAIPVLLTPVSRRRFDSAGNVLETHAVYSALVKEVAKETNSLFIDLDSKSRELYQKFGKEGSRLLFLQLKAGEHPNYPEGKEDNTHFNELGARLIAQLVLQEIRASIPELSSRIVIPTKK
jgi:lysophospholipase L1-like esterase